MAGFDPRSVVRGASSGQPLRARPAGSAPKASPVLARRRTLKWLAFGMDRPNAPPKEDQRQTRRDLRAAVIFGVVAATIELAALLYFFR